MNNTFVETKSQMVIECPCCGKVFEYHRTRGGQRKYCSEECARRVKYERKKQRANIEVTCEVCNNTFISMYQGAKYCSDHCYKESIALYRSTCEVCGERFKGRKGRANKFCSRKCYHESLNNGGYIPHKAINSTTDYSSYKRAGRFGVEREYINVHEVFENYNWVCGICNKKVDKTIPYPNTLSASLDHIKPLSKGGTHTYNNVQLAHLGCNLKKNNHYKETPRSI